MEAKVCILDAAKLVEISVTRVSWSVAGERRGYESDVKGLTKIQQLRRPAASEGSGINGRNQRTYNRTFPFSERHDSSFRTRAKNIFPVNHFSSQCAEGCARLIADFIFAPKLASGELLN